MENTLWPSVFMGEEQVFKVRYTHNLHEKLTQNNKVMELNLISTSKVLGSAISEEKIFEYSYQKC